MMGAVISVEENGLYKIGTNSGVLNQLYSRNQFQPCLEKFVHLKDIPSKSISLREAARTTSNGTGQGFLNVPATTIRDVKIVGASVSKQM